MKQRESTDHLVWSEKELHSYGHKKYEGAGGRACDLDLGWIPTARSAPLIGPRTFHLSPLPPKLQTQLALLLLNITSGPQAVAAVQNQKAVQTLADAAAQALPVSGSDAP